MRFSSDGGDVGLGHRAVDLNLLESEAVVAVDPFLRLVGVIYALNAQGKRSITVDNASRQDSRTEAVAIGDRIADGGDEFEFIAAITDSSYAGGEIDRTPFNLLEVGVHVP